MQIDSTQQLHGHSALLWQTASAELHAAKFQQHVSIFQRLMKLIKKKENVPQRQSKYFNMSKVGMP